MATPYSNESDVTGDGWVKVASASHDGVVRYEKTIDGAVREISVASTTNTAAAAEGFRSYRVARGKSA